MAEELSSQSYCEVCGIDVDPNTKLKRFDKLFCSDEHMDQYVKARQKNMGISGPDVDNIRERDDDGQETSRGAGFGRRRGGCC